MFAGIYPEDPDDYEELQKSLDVQEIDSDAELASLKAELGLSESYSE